MIDTEKFMKDKYYRFGVRSYFFINKHKFKIGLFIGWLMHIFFNWIYPFKGVA
jgi:hypothetical protein